MSSLDIASLNRQGKVFCAANVSAKSVVAVSTTETGVILHNPPGSGKKLVIIHGGFVWTTVPGALHNLGWGLMAANPVLPTSLTAIGSGVLAADGSGNAGQSVARAYDAATLPTAPVAVRWFGGAAWVTGASVGPYIMVDYVEGALAVVPGAAAALIVVTTTAVGMGSVCWAEVDL